MKKYEVRGTSVIELATELVIFNCQDAKKSKQVAKDLNNGIGFDGWTPEFILRDKVFGTRRL